MDKALFCLLVFAGICCVKAEVNEELVTDTTATTHVPTTPVPTTPIPTTPVPTTHVPTTPVPTTPIPTTPVPTTPLTETTHSPIVDSTSDSLLDIYPHLTESFTTTTSTAEPEEHVNPDPKVTGDHKEYSSEEVGDDLASSSESVCDEELSPADVQTFEKAMNKFSMDLLKQVELESQNPNVVVSPFSIALALLQLGLGAENQTEKHILETLHVESLQCLHEKLQKVTKRLVKSSLSVATRMYIQKGFQIKKSFLKRSERLYGTKPVNLKQDMQQNLEDINKWVKDATGGKIPNFLSNIPSNIVLMLLNALHFKDSAVKSPGWQKRSWRSKQDREEKEREQLQEDAPCESGIWRNKFDPAKTVPDVFAINDDETVIVDMMHSLKYPLRYFIHEKTNSQVARIPFKGNTSLVVVVPNNMNWNLSSILDKLNRTELYNRLHKEKPTLLKVPKLNLDFKLELGHVLSNLGLGELFTNPNLKGISDDHLFVSSVEHQSTLQLNEEGVEAAAATASIMSRSLSTFSINRPFLFFLYDDRTGLPLFLGFVRNPKPGSQKKRKESSFIPDLKPFSKGSIPK